VNAQVVSEKEIKAIEVFEDPTFKLYMSNGIATFQSSKGKKMVRTSQHTTTTEFTTPSAWSCQRTTLPGKLLYREMCEANLAWDGEFPETLTNSKWGKEWYEQFPEPYTVPRTLAPN
jgi:ABC-type uncharacterized transport system permease subunit